MFSMSHYEAVARAYVKGLERCADAGQGRFGGVVLRQPGRHRGRQRVGKNRHARKRKRLLGKIAIANSKVVYRRFMEIFHGEGFASLRSRGARVQRPLWASTGTKNPAYSDVLYVENLIGPETVNTLPPDTINAFRDHGKIPGATVKTGFDDADAALATLAKLGINLDAITEKLQVDGVASFSASFDQLMARVGEKAPGDGRRRLEPSRAPPRQIPQARRKTAQGMADGSSRQTYLGKRSQSLVEGSAAGTGRSSGLARACRKPWRKKSPRSARSPTKPKPTA